MDVDAGFDARLRADDVTFTGRDAALLDAIAEAGSLNRAADTLGRSYSRAHGRLERLEAAFGLDEKADVVWRYEKQDADQLRREGHIE